MRRRRRRKRPSTRASTRSASGFPTPPRFTRALELHGFTEVRLRAWVRDDLRTVGLPRAAICVGEHADRRGNRSAPTRGRARNSTQPGTTFEQATPVIRERLVSARRARADRRLAVGSATPHRRRDPAAVSEHPLGGFPSLSNPAKPDVHRSAQKRPQQLAAVEQRVADHRGQRAAARQVHHAPRRAERAGDDRGVAALQRVAQAEREAGDQRRPSTAGRGRRESGAAGTRAAALRARRRRRSPRPGTSRCWRRVPSMPSSGLSGTLCSAGAKRRIASVNATTSVMISGSDSHADADLAAAAGRSPKNTVERPLAAAEQQPHDQRQQQHGVGQRQQRTRRSSDSDPSAVERADARPATSSWPMKICVG